MAEQFLFDDFFVAQDATDPGELLEVPMKGRTVPLHIKRGMSHADKQAAKKVGIKTHITPKGAVEIVDVDEGEFAVELIFRALVSWPFKYNDGRPVKITRENIRLMFDGNTEAIAERLAKRSADKDAEMKNFTKPSEKASEEG